MIIGTVRSYDSFKGYGFIQSLDGDKTIYVDADALNSSAIQILTPGQFLCCDVKQDNHGHNLACNITLLEPHTIAK